MNLYSYVKRQHYNPKMRREIKVPLGFSLYVQSQHTSCKNMFKAIATKPYSMFFIHQHFPSTVFGSGRTTNIFLLFNGNTLSGLKGVWNDGEHTVSSLYLLVVWVSFNLFYIEGNREHGADG